MVVRRNPANTIDHLHYDDTRAKPDGSCSRPAETGSGVVEMEAKQAGDIKTLLRLTR